MQIPEHYQTLKKFEAVNSYELKNLQQETGGKNKQKN
jgi:hypothetical protein